MKPTFALTRSAYAHTLGLACFLALSLTGSHLAAQTAASASANASAKSVPLDQIPKLEMEEGPNTLKKPDTNNKPLPSTRDTTTTLKQSSAQGKATEVEVKKGKNTYYVKPNEPKGSALRGDVQSNPIRGTQWKVMDFNSKPKKANPGETAPTPVSVAPAAAPAPAKGAASASTSASAPAPDNSLALPPTLETK